jgi:hypothetical protein
LARVLNRRWARDSDDCGTLLPAFGLPAGILPGSPEDLVIRTEEGWILGV